MGQLLSTRAPRRFGHARLIFSLLLLLPLSVLAQSPRPRDPWAFRIILENKARQMVLALRSDLWLAFNPANCANYKVWGGTGAGITYRGKVWDFSENNSFTNGTTYHLDKSAIVSLTSSAISSPWASANVSVSGTISGGGVTYPAYSFSASNATITSPVVDLTKYTNPILSFYESGGGSIHVQVSPDGGTTWTGVSSSTGQTAQEFDSAQNGSDPPINLKLIAVTGNNVRFRFILNGTNTGKVVANIILYGDYNAWTATQNGAPVSVTADWRGYRTVSVTQSAFLQYDIVFPGNVRASVEENPEYVGTSSAITRAFQVKDLPANSQIALDLTGTPTGKTESWVVTSGPGVIQSVNGDSILQITNSTSAPANISTTIQGSWQ